MYILTQFTFSSITATINKNYPEVASTLRLLDYRCEQIHWAEVCSEIDGYVSRFDCLKDYHGESICQEFDPLESSLSDLKRSVAIVHEYFDSLLRFFGEREQEYSIDSFLSHFHAFYTSFLVLSSSDAIYRKYGVEDVISVDSSDTSDSDDFSFVCWLLKQ